MPGRRTGGPEGIDMWCRLVTTFCRFVVFSSADLVLPYGDLVLRNLDCAEEFEVRDASATESGTSKVVGGDVEGAVYMTLFVECAQRPGIGLDYVVTRYVRSHALTYRELACHIRLRHGVFSRQYQQLPSAGRVWSMPDLPIPTVREVVEPCLGLSGTISLLDDVMRYPLVAQATQGNSLVSALNFIDLNCVLLQQISP